jgi:hypothetical protein
MLTSYNVALRPPGGRPLSVLDDVMTVEALGGGENDTGSDVHSLSYKAVDVT